MSVSPLLGAFLGGLIFLAAADARAEEPTGITGNDEVHLDLTGQIAPRCGFELEAREFDLGDLAQWTAPINVPFEMSCNTAFVMELFAQNGSLRFAGSGSFERPFLTELNYTLRVQVETHDASMLDAPILVSAAGSSLVAGAVIDSGGRIASGAASLTITPEPRPVDALYVAGHYREHVEIRLIPKI